MAKISDTILNLLKGWWNNKSSLLSSATDTLLALLHTAQPRKGGRAELFFTTPHRRRTPLLGGPNPLGLVALELVVRVLHAISLLDVQIALARTEL